MMHSYAFPGDLAPEIAAIGSEPIPYMRTQEFSDIVLESEKILLKLIHCTGGRTIIYTGSGTGAIPPLAETSTGVPHIGHTVAPSGNLVPHSVQNITHPPTSRMFTLR